VTNPFASLTSGAPADGPKIANATPSDPQGPSQKSILAQDAGAAKRIPNDSGGATILRHPAAPEPSPTAKYLDQDVDLEALRIPFVRFPGTKMVLPYREVVCS